MSKMLTQTKQEREEQFQRNCADKALRRLGAGKPERGHARRIARAEWRKNNALLPENKQVTWKQYRTAK